MADETTKTAQTTVPKTEEKKSMPAERIHKYLNFSALEAYKMLRANVLFSLPDEGKCRIIGITSSIRGEGKSTTSINLSYTLAEMGKNVLLIDGDLRLPSIASKMEMTSKPGLSDILVYSEKTQINVRQTDVLKNWYVLTSGPIPPNPSELLGTKRMKNLLEMLTKSFDFIIIDLPPVNIVADPIVMSPLLDGMIVVVREDYTDKKSLKNCINSLQLADAKVLGFVVNDAKNKEKAYRYRRYGHYGKGKYYRNNYSKYYRTSYYYRRPTKGEEEEAKINQKKKG